MELFLHADDRLAHDQLVEHHREPRVAARHTVERSQSGTHVLEGFQNVPSFFPFEIQPDDFNRFVEAQILEDLNVEEVIERLPDVGDSVEVHRRSGQQQAAVVGHEKLAESSDVVPVAELPAEDLAQVLQHD